VLHLGGPVEKAVHRRFGKRGVDPTKDTAKDGAPKSALDP
jgi:hypothetical protein